MNSLPRWAQGWLLILMLALSAPVLAQGKVLFTYGGFTYAADDLPLQLQQAFFEAESEAYKKKQGIIERAVLDLYLEAEAERRDISVEKLRNELLPIPPVGDLEARRFYDQNRANIPAPFEQVKPQIVAYIQTQKVAELEAKLLAELREESDLKIHLKAPVAPVYDIDTSGRPFKGAEDAPVVLVEFADYQCPHCKNAHLALDRIMKDYGARVKLVFMDFPINRSGISRRVAEGALCAQKQDKFWAYADDAFARQGMLNANSPFEIAKAVDLDMDKFGRCYDSAEVRARVAQSYELGKAIGVNSTPTFFLNGRRLELENFNASLRDVLDEALKEQP